MNFSELIKLKYKDVIRGWNLDHFNMSSNFSQEKNINNMSPSKAQKSEEVEQIYYTKTNKFKKNICLIYKNIFNENQREEIQNDFNIAINPNSGSYNEDSGLLHADYNLIDVNKNYNIPKIISRLHPNLKEKEYFALSKNPGFLNKNALVCETCFLEIIAHSHANQNLKQVIVKHQKDREIIGTGKLDPQSIAYRYKVAYKFPLKLRKKRKQEKE